jgi:cysteine desulfuration protein SufE
MPTRVSIEEICEDFADLDDPEDQLQYVIELGRELPGLPKECKTEQNRVQGCQSNVWLVAQPVPDATASDQPPALEFLADSDAIIVRGIVAVLLAAFSGRRPQEILDFPIQQVFERLQLTRFLSPLRSNGLHSMVVRIQLLAKLAAAKWAAEH